MTLLDIAKPLIDRGTKITTTMVGTATDRAGSLLGRFQRGDSSPEPQRTEPKATAPARAKPETAPKSAAGTVKANGPTKSQVDSAVKALAGTGSTAATSDAKKS